MTMTAPATATAAATATIIVVHNLQHGWLGRGKRNLFNWSKKMVNNNVILIYN